jgi:hypothetical protein
LFEKDLCGFGPQTLEIELSEPNAAPHLGRDQNTPPAFLIHF